MLTEAEIKQFIDEDNASRKKKRARTGARYYDGNHDIKDYRLFYYDADGVLKEDHERSNIKICHTFFTELVDQAVQYMLSNDVGIIKSDVPELQTVLDEYFNENENFMSDLAEVLTDMQSKGFAFMYAYVDENGHLQFSWADAIGVVEVEGRFAQDKKDQVIYWYVDRVDKDGKMIKRIINYDDTQIAYFVQADDGKILRDPQKEINPKPHIFYKVEGDSHQYYDEFGFVPFFRLDNNRKQISALMTIKDLIDDYDLMASSLSNNLVDFDTPIHVVKGFEGDSLDELQKNLRTKKIIGLESTDAGAGVEIKTVDVPFEARCKKLEVDEKNIYRFGMGLNTAGLKDTNATTNVAIKSAYSLLDLKCYKMEMQLKKFLRKLIDVVLKKVNDEKQTDYRQKDVYFDFKHEVMSNAQENAQIELIEAQRTQAQINTLLGLQSVLDNETMMMLICEQLDIDYDDIKGKLPVQEDAYGSVRDAQSILDGMDDE